MAKRKAKEVQADTLVGEPRRSKRRAATNVDEEVPEIRNVAKTAKVVKKARKMVEEEGGDGSGGEDGKNGVQPPPPSAKSTPKARPSTAPVSNIPPTTTRQYWLMKAEPESRLEKGHDVKFSIDDLAAKTEPEPWDGIRAYPARNNLRAMKKGDLAFFYHSSCKVPAIVGIMEIVKEHSPDLSAHDPHLPYYDASSPPDNPKWSVVHVSFRQKLGTSITLRDLKEMQEEKGSPLKDMQMLRQTRLSVSKVSEEEWRFLVGKMKERGDVVKE